MAYICLNLKRLFCLSLDLFGLLIQLIMRGNECWTNRMQAILTGRDYHLLILLLTPECVMSDVLFTTTMTNSQPLRALVSLTLHPRPVS